MSELLLLGIDHCVGSELTVLGSGALAAAMSVGDERAATWRSKGGLVNEDALSGRDDGRYARLAVADAHFGSEASRLIVEALHDAPLDRTAPALSLSPTDDGSETTLTVVWLDRESSEVQVHWCGDSQALLLRPGGDVVDLHEVDSFYTSPQEFSWDLTMHARFLVEQGDVLVAYTDGVHECNRGHPDRSIRPHHVVSILEGATDLEAFVRELGTTALVGVGPNRGGEDNIAIVALTV